MLGGQGLDRDRYLDSVSRFGELRRLVDAVGASLAGDIEQQSLPDATDPLARALGERSAAVVVEVYAGVEPPVAHELCRVGLALQPRVTLLGEVLPVAHPFVQEAVEAGLVSIGAADRILSALDLIAGHSTAEDRAEVEAALVQRAPELTSRQLGAACRRVLDTFNPDGVESREDLLRTRSGVQVSRTREGLVRWIVTMHPEAAGFLTAAVDARTAPRRQPTFVDEAGGGAGASAATEQGDDWRPLHERRLDALVGIARESLGRDHGTLAGTSVTMSVTVSLDALLTGIGTAKIAGIDERISAGTARRLAADAEIIPVVLGGPSEPLDLGRAVRLCSEPQRRAIAIRDGGCIWPGCSAPAGWCELAHIVAWANGGSTDIDNVMMLCPFHHRRFDLDGWQLLARDGERWLVPPPWVDSAQTPRRVGPLREPALA
ncbi:hypothetical protein BH09ACT4_BH09ACT4_09340 [soil metagenome]